MHISAFTLMVQRLRQSEPFVLPSRAYPHDAGVDLCVSRPCTVMPYAWAIISTNLAVGVPDGFWVMLIPRSSTFYNKRLLVHSAVIDSGYRGEVQAMVFNPTGDRINVSTGERLFQLVAHANVLANVKESPQLPPGERDEAGFGSTGGYTGDGGTGGPPVL